MVRSTRTTSERYTDRKHRITDELTSDFRCDDIDPRSSLLLRTAAKRLRTESCTAQGRCQGLTAGGVVVCTERCFRKRLYACTLKDVCMRVVSSVPASGVSVIFLFDDLKSIEAGRGYRNTPRDGVLSSLL